MVHHIVLQDPPEEHWTVSWCRRRSQGARSNKRHDGQIAHFSHDKKRAAHHKCNGISLYGSQAMIRSIYHIGPVPCHIYIHRYCTRSTYAHICSLKSIARKRTLFYAHSERQGHQGTYMTALNPSYRSRVQWLRLCNYKASGPLHAQPNMSTHEHACVHARQRSPCAHRRRAR